jgi:hypothetical protein
VTLRNPFVISHLVGESYNEKSDWDPSNHKVCIGI